jgi:hypothetical protein
MHENSQFIMKPERDSHLPFLDIHIYNKPDGSLGHEAYHKTTQTH